MNKIIKKIAIKVLPRDTRMKLRSASKRKFLLEQMPILIDPWFEGSPSEEKRYQKVRNRFHSEIKSGKVVVHRSFSHEVVGRFENDYFDWIYLDGGHSYKNLTEQFSDYLPKVKPNGFISGDDYARDETTPYADEVTRAVDEFILKKLTKTVEIRNNQFVLQKI
jgi:hypothetical protein